ncbi:hypothetical protein PFISCL1PPCAC_2549 [Pristionchus fissidentatus]|uniref:Major facilitator superfamily (MFS) profile domain-containing protein n=1 Tax=Pristionchus fissidentatus TaxID=1538716 RepID=A0AAV5UXE3_9BILA|nr:hypothetical protein PFISCL1PPCAC_2549 [Pristionchus fissidentatus]
MGSLNSGYDATTEEPIPEVKWVDDDAIEVESFCVARESTIPLWRRLTSVLILTLLSLFTMFDRYVTAGILPALQKYYNISNTWGGLLQTFYVAFYVVCLLIVGIVGDRMSRKLIILISTTVWIIFMVASSFIPANMFWLFLIVRSLTSIGIAAVNALSPSLFADYFTGSGRGFALMIFFMSLPIGASSSIAFGSTLVDTPNFLWAIRLCPIIAIVLLILAFFFLEEPIRGGLEDSIAEEGGSVQEDFFKIVAVKAFWFSCLPTILVNFYLSGYSWWQATLVENAMNSTDYDPEIYHGIQYDQWMGISSVVTCVVGILGAFIGVNFSEAWRDGKFCFRKSIRAPAFTVGLSCLLSAPCYFAYLLLINKNIILAIAITSLGTVVSGGIFPLDVEIVLMVIPPSRRAAAVSIMNILMCVTGDGPAPFIVGFITDLFLGGSTVPVDQFFSLQKTLLVCQGLATTSFVFAFVNSVIFPKEMLKSE